MHSRYSFSKHLYTETELFNKKLSNQCHQLQLEIHNKILGILLIQNVLALFKDFPISSAQEIPLAHDWLKDM